MFDPCACSLLAGLVRLTEVIMEVRELITKACHPFVKVGCLLADARGVLSGLSRFARRALGLGLGFSA
jgi:hypothetical protein